MVILQKPSALTHSGNIVDLIISSAASVNLKLFNGVDLILEESYSPDANNRVQIELKELVDGLLSVQVPSGSPVFHQTGAYADFRVELNGSEDVSFRVVKGGVDTSTPDTAAFLLGNFLTWQPQQKQVQYHDPEWLSYYAIAETAIQAKGYFPNSNETITLATIPAGQLNTIDVNYGTLIGKFSSQPLYVDIWAQQGGARVSFVQRYILSGERLEFNDIFVFENSLGGIDTIRFTGEAQQSYDYKFDTARFDENLLDFGVSPDHFITKNSGYFRSDREKAWSLEFFSSLQKYYRLAGALKRIVVTKPNLEAVAGKLADYTFDFAYSKQTKYLNLLRPDEVPAELEILGPDQELFFLAPRLNEFQDIESPEDAIVPVQSPTESKWFKMTVGAIVGLAVSAAVAAMPTTPSAHSHDISDITGLQAVLDSKMTGNINSWIQNGTDLQPGAQFHVDGARVAKYFIGPKAAPAVGDMIPGEFYEYNLENGSGAPGSTPFGLFDLAGIQQVQPLAQDHVLRYNATTGKFENAPANFGGTPVDAYTKTESDARYASITGYNKTDWDAAVTNSHSHSNKSILDGITSLNDFIKNQTDLQSAAQFHVKGARIAGYFIGPKAAPAVGDMIAGEFYEYNRENGSGATGATPLGLFDLAGIQQVQPLAQDHVLRYNATTGKFENAPANFGGTPVDAYTKTESDARYASITGYNKTDWDAAVTDRHSHSNKSVLDAITSTKVTNWDAASTNSHSHSNKSVLDGITSLNDFIRNQSGLQTDAQFHVKGARIAGYYIGPKAAPAVADMIAGEFYEYTRENGSGAPAASPTGLFDLAGIQQVGTLTNGQVLKYNSTSGKWENAADGGGDLTKAAADTYYLGISATAADSHKFGGIGYEGALANPASYLLAFNATTSKFGVATQEQARGFLGLGSAAYQNASAFLGATATAVDSTKWNGMSYTGGNMAVTPTYMMAYSAASATWQRAQPAVVQAFLGLGSNAYSSTAYLPLSGGILSGPPTLQWTAPYMYWYSTTFGTSSFIQTGVNSSATIDSATNYMYFYHPYSAGFYFNNNITLTGALTGTSATFSGAVSLGSTGYFRGASINGVGFRFNSSDDAYNNVIFYDNGTSWFRGALTGTSATFSAYMSANRLISTGYALAENPTLGSGSLGASAVLSANGLYGLYTGVSPAGHVWMQVQRNDANPAVYPLALQPSGGNVGIGTTSPAYKLDVNGDTSVSGILKAKGIGVDNADSTTGIGISLYNGALASMPTYGLMFAGTASFGTHGYVTGDWATYFTMNTSAGRGWIFKAGTGSGIASISNAGHVTFNGNMMLGTRNGAKDSVVANRILIAPPSHSGTWAVGVKDDATSAHIGIYYGATEVVRANHRGHLFLTGGFVAPSGPPATADMEVGKFYEYNRSI